MGDLAWELVRDLVKADRRGALVAIVAGSGLGAKLLVTPDAVEGSLGDPALDETATGLARELLPGEEAAGREVDCRELFFDVYAPQPRLLIVGAVDFAAALARLAHLTGFKVSVIDARERFAPRSASRRRRGGDRLAPGVPGRQPARRRHLCRRAQPRAPLRRPDPDRPAAQPGRLHRGHGQPPGPRRAAGAAARGRVRRRRHRPHLRPHRPRHRGQVPRGDGRVDPGRGDRGPPRPPWRPLSARTAPVHSIRERGEL